VDVFYDHFLAKNWHLYCDEKLEEFVYRFYKSLHDNQVALTLKTQNLMPYMIKQNWLVSYRSIDGIKQILTQMDHRTKNESKMRFATNELSEFYFEFENEFTPFFKDLISFSNVKLNTL
jgi:acyl carrier protein phosphodiesterase